MIISISSFESQSNKNHVKFSRYKKLIYIIEAFDTLIIRDNMCQFDRLIDIINNYTDKNGNRMELKVYF